MQLQLSSHLSYEELKTAAIFWLQVSSPSEAGGSRRGHQRHREAMGVDALTRGNEKPKGGKNKRGKGTNNDDWKKEAECYHCH